MLGINSTLSITEKKMSSPISKEVGEWGSLGDNWDGEGESAINIISMHRASFFAEQMWTFNFSPMLLSSGNVGLFYRDILTYVDLEFGFNKILYFIKHGDRTYKGEVIFAGDTMPTDLIKLLRARSLPNG